MVYNKSVRKGYFRPKFPEKYSGEVNNIVYRSNLEKRFFKVLDENPNIITWGSETLVIPYVSPVDGKIHHYYTDLIVKTKKGEVFVIEIKPYAFTQEPKKGNKSKKTYITEVINYAVNQSKWKACSKFCEQKNWHFKIMTEKDLLKAK